MKPWLRPHLEGTLLNLYIRPGASRSEIAGIHAERLKIKIKAPPREGEANAGLIEFLSEVLKISKSRIELIRGESSRQKDVWVELPPDDVTLLLKA